jgi:hypothetical protein
VHGRASDHPPAIGSDVDGAPVLIGEIEVDMLAIKALKPKPNGGRKHENMSLAEEKALLARFAKAAGAGEMLNSPSVLIAPAQARTRLRP